MRCVVCDTADTTVRWTDTHGVAVCTTCGMPYRMLHYDERGRSVDQPPSVGLNERGIVLAKRYWAKHKPHWVFPGSYDVLGTSHRRGDRTYSGATPEDMRMFADWHRAAIKGDDLDDAIEDNGGGFTA